VGHSGLVGLGIAGVTQKKLLRISAAAFSSARRFTAR
jgi:hypothetical protein